MSSVPRQQTDLSTRRCVNHPQREAVARCLQCRQFFCRECVTEHGGKLTCAVCLGKQAAGKAAGGGVMSALAGVATFAAGLIVAWICFYYIGTFLVGLPDSFHEGLMWGK